MTPQHVQYLSGALALIVLALLIYRRSTKAKKPNR